MTFTRFKPNFLTFSILHKSPVTHTALFGVVMKFPWLSSMAGLNNQQNSKPSKFATLILTLRVVKTSGDARHYAVHPRFLLRININETTSCIIVNENLTSN